MLFALCILNHIDDPCLDGCREFKLQPSSHPAIPSIFFRRNVEDPSGKSGEAVLLGITQWKLSIGRRGTDPGTDIKSGCYPWPDLSLVQRTWRHWSKMKRRHGIFGKMKWMKMYRSEHQLDGAYYSRQWKDWMLNWQKHTWTKQAWHWKGVPQQKMNQ